MRNLEILSRGWIYTFRACAQVVDFGISRHHSALEVDSGIPMDKLLGFGCLFFP